MGSSPVGLSMVTKLSPQGLVSTVMGGWFLATAFSNYLAAVIAARSRASRRERRACRSFLRPPRRSRPTGTSSGSSAERAFATGETIVHARDVGEDGDSQRVGPAEIAEPVDGRCRHDHLVETRVASAGDPTRHSAPGRQSSCARRNSISLVVGALGHSIRATLFA